MTNILFAALGVCVAMIFQDAFATTEVIAEQRNLGRWAGAMDGLNDYASRFGTLLTAGAYVHTGMWSWQTQFLLGVTAVTSYNTTSRMTGLAHRILPKARPE